MSIDKEVIWVTKLTIFSDTVLFLYTEVIYSGVDVDVDTG